MPYLTFNHLQKVREAVISNHLPGKEYKKDLPNLSTFNILIILVSKLHHSKCQCLLHCNIMLCSKLVYIVPKVLIT